MTIFLKWCKNQEEVPVASGRAQALPGNDAKKRTFVFASKGGMGWVQQYNGVMYYIFAAFVSNRFSKSAKMMMWHKVRGGVGVGVAAAAEPGWNSLQRVGHVNTVSRRVGGRLRVEGEQTM